MDDTNKNLGKNSDTLEKNSFKKMDCLCEVKDHKSEVLSMCLTADGRIASSSKKGIILVYDILTFYDDLVITGHLDAVNHISLLDNGFLISSSSDKTVLVWEIFKCDYLCVGEINIGPAIPYKTMQLSSNRIGCCDSLGEIKIFSDTTYSLEYKIKGHKGEVRTIVELKNKKYIVSIGGWDKEVKFWESKKYTLEQNIKNVRCMGVNGITEMNDKLIIGESSGMVTIINTETLQLETTVILKTYIGNIYSVCEGGPSKVIMGNEHGNIIEFDIIRCKVLIVKKYYTYIGKINDLMCFKSDMIISCSQDVMRIWKE